MKISSQRVVGNTFSQLFFRLLMVVMSILTTRWLTRLLGVGGYASFGFFTSLITLFNALGDWGTQLVMIREGSGRKDMSRFWWNAGSGRLGLMGISWLVYLVYVCFVLNREFYQDFLVWGSLILFFFSIKTTVQAVFQIKQRHGWGAFLEFLSALFFFLLIASGRLVSLSGAVTGLIVAAGVAAFLGLIGLISYQKPLGRLDFRLIGNFLRNSWPVGWVVVIYSAYSRVSVFFLRQFGTEAELGQYLLASKVYDNLILGAAYLMNVLYPLVSAWRADRVARQKMNRLLSYGLTTLAVAGVFVLIIGWWSAGWVVNFLGGEDFGESVLFLRGLLLVLVVGYFNHLTGYVLLALNQQQKYFFIGLLGLTISIGGHFIFYYWFGGVGVVIAGLVAEVLIFVLSYRYLRKRLGYRLQFQPISLGKYLVNEWNLKR